MKSTTRKLTILSFAFAFGLIACPAFAATETWSDGIGDWFDGSNWSTGMVPAATDDVFINNGGTAHIVSAGAVGADLGLGVAASESGRLVLSGSGTLTLDNATFLEIGGEGAGTLTINADSTVSDPTNAFIGTFAGSTGTVTVNGGTWNNGGVVEVGSSGAGTCTIQNGGTVTSGGAFVGTFAGSTGTATVDGPGSTWSTDGVSVGGRLLITNGGVVTNGGSLLVTGVSPDTGLVTVDGLGSVLANPYTTFDFDLGPAVGTTSTLNVTNGAVFSLDHANMYVGGLSEGPFGIGLIRIADGGSVTAPNIIVWSTGTLEIGAGAILNIVGGEFQGFLTFEGGVLRAIANTTLTPDTIFDFGTVGIVDSNGFTCTLSGVLGGQGQLTKVNHGTVILTNGDNYYEGGTIVTAGILSVMNETGSATGIGPVQVNAGKLSGSGIISGAVTVGTGSGAGAFLAPGGQGAAKPVVLTIQSNLTLKADATYRWKLNTKRAGADKVIANGVTIDSGASFTFKGLGQVALTPGTIFTVIDNTAATPIAGTFSNLADGSIFTANGNNFQANYEGGDGNDLTLTVVP